MSTPGESVRLAAEAQTAARDAAARMILHAEAWASAAAAVRAVRALELAVHAEVLGHIRRAREAGESWGAIGELLGFGPIAAERPGPLAELAYDYSAGLPTVDPFPARRCFGGTAPGCGGRIADHGPVKGPALIRTATAAAACAWPPMPQTGTRRPRNERTRSLPRGRAAAQARVQDAGHRRRARGPRRARDSARAPPPPWPPLTHCSRLLHPPGSARTLIRWTPRHGAMRLPPPAGPSAATRSGCRRATASAMSPRRVRGRTTAPTRSPGSGTRRPGDRVRGA